ERPLRTPKALRPAAGDDDVGSRPPHVHTESLQAAQGGRAVGRRGEVLNPGLAVGEGPEQGEPMRDGLVSGEVEAPAETSGVAYSHAPELAIVSRQDPGRACKCGAQHSLTGMRVRASFACLLHESCSRPDREARYREPLRPAGGGPVRPERPGE